MSRTANLRRQHEELLAYSAQLQEHLRLSDLAEDAEEVFALLSDLTAKLRFHLMTEDHGLYPELLGSDLPGASHLARKLQREMGGITDAFEDYAKRWLSPVQIEADPESFVLETRAVLAALTKRIELENRDLYRLADQNQPTHKPDR